MKKTGIFICHCGVNIAGCVDVKKVAERLSEVPGVCHSTDYIYMCSEPGQQIIREAIGEKGLEGIVVACCSPSMHEKTFRKAAKMSGINPYLCEIANIREQCSWVHQKRKAEATDKAFEIIMATVAKLRRNMPLHPISMAISRRALVIGGGLAGMTAALDMADGGYEVLLVEREASLGGRAAQVSMMFPDMEEASGHVSTAARKVCHHPRITVFCHSEVEEIKGYVGNFNVNIRRKKSHVNWEKCTGCGDCIGACPVDRPSAFERDMARVKAIDVLHALSIPGKPVLDEETCLRFNDRECSLCRDACPVGAIDFDDSDGLIEEMVGAIVVATGYDLYPKENMGEYGCQDIDDVIDSMAFERMLAPGGITGGKIIRPSDGRVPKEIVFIQCVGSRDPDRHMPYCSRICCMYTAKHARLYKQQVPDGQPYVFYMDIRCDSKGYEEFLQKSVEDEKILYLRGRVSKIYQDDGRVVVSGVDTLTGRAVDVRADMVVLATAMVPSSGVRDLAAKLRATIDKHGYMTEAHIKLYPVESSTKGIYLAGCAQGPKDIPDTISQASATAGKIQALLSSEELLQDPLIAYVEDDICSGCAICVEMCPYEARMMDERKGISTVNDALCQGCGACVASCPNKACELRNCSSIQMLRIVDTFIPEMGGVHEG